MFISVLILKDILHIILLYVLNSLACYNPKLTFEEIRFLLLYITNLTAHGTTKNKVGVLSYNVRFLNVCRYRQILVANS